VQGVYVFRPSRRTITLSDIQHAEHGFIAVTCRAIGRPMTRSRLFRSECTSVRRILALPYPPVIVVTDAKNGPGPSGVLFAAGFLTSCACLAFGSRSIGLVCPDPPNMGCSMQSFPFGIKAATERRGHRKIFRLFQAVAACGRLVPAQRGDAVRVRPCDTACF